MKGGRFLGAVHWVGAVTLGAEGSYLSYGDMFDSRLGRRNGSKKALLWPFRVKSLRSFGYWDVEPQ